MKNIAFGKINSIMFYYVFIKINAFTVFPNLGWEWRMMNWYVMCRRMLWNIRNSYTFILDICYVSIFISMIGYNLNAAIG
jgi:hypothetical protein